MKNVSKVDKYDELMSTIFACVNAFKQAYDDEIGCIKDPYVDLRVDNVVNNQQISIQFLRGRTILEANTIFLEGIKNKLRLSKSLLKRKVVIYNDCIVVDSKSSTGIRIEPTNKFSGDHAYLISPDDYDDWPSTEVLFGKHSLNESDQMFVKLFENKNRRGYEGCDDSTYKELKYKLDDITDYLHLKVNNKKFNKKKCISIITQEEIDYIAQKFEIKSSTPLLLKDISLDYSFWYEGAYDELEGAYDEDEIDDDMIADTTRDAMIDNEECLPVISFKFNNKWYRYYPEDWDYDFEAMPKSVVEKIISCIK